MREGKGMATLEEQIVSVFDGYVMMPDTLVELLIGAGYIPMPELPEGVAGQELLAVRQRMVSELAQPHLAALDGLIEAGTVIRHDGGAISLATPPTVP